MMVGLVLSTAGCGSFVARRMAQAPNTYPSWLAPTARVQLAFSDAVLSNFPSRCLEVGPPPARMRYRIVEPADFHFEVSATNWVAHAKKHFKFTFHAEVPGKTNPWTTKPRGTVLLLHGWGVSEFAMAPWALRLAQDGWRCVLLDLRGHGKATGPRIYFGLRETHDLSELLDTLAHNGELALPVAAVGESYGAALALRWKDIEPRVGNVVAIAPYASLSNAVLNICREYAPCLPRCWLRAGLKQLPHVLETEPAALDTTTVLGRTPVAALFVAGAEDQVTPVEDVRELHRQAAPASQLIIVPAATHEALPYFFEDLAGVVEDWLARPAAHASRTQGVPTPK